MKFKLLQNILFAILLAFTVNSFVYFGFVNSYSSSILNYQNFSEQFNSGIYQYRIFSASLLFWIYDVLTSLGMNYDVFKFKFLNPDSEPQMYFAFYILNTLFLVFSAVIMVLITERKNFIATNAEKILMVSVGIFIISLTQFVIVPYDCSSYFFLLLFFYVFLKYAETQSTVLVTVLIFIMIISALNRETSALSLSLAATILFIKYGISKKAIVPVGILTFSFIIIYLGLRFSNNSFTTNDGNLLPDNFTQPKNLLGILFWLVFFVFTLKISENAENRKLIIFFHLFAFPYILMCFYSGILYETRLYVPIFLTCLFLAKTNIPKIH